jgi:hypothetical protein
MFFLSNICLSGVWSFGQRVLMLILSEGVAPLSHDWACPSLGVRRHNFRYLWFSCCWGVLLGIIRWSVKILMLTVIHGAWALVHMRSIKKRCIVVDWDSCRLLHETRMNRQSTVAVLSCGSSLCRRNKRVPSWWLLVNPSHIVWIVDRATHRLVIWRLNGTSWNLSTFPFSTPSKKQGALNRLLRLVLRTIHVSMCVMGWVYNLLQIFHTHYTKLFFFDFAQVIHVAVALGRQILHRTNVCIFMHDSVPLSGVCLRHHSRPLERAKSQVSEVLHRHWSVELQNIGDDTLVGNISSGHFLGVLARDHWSATSLGSHHHHSHSIPLKHWVIKELLGTLHHGDCCCFARVIFTIIIKCIKILHGSAVSLLLKVALIWTILAHELLRKFHSKDV